MEADGDGDIRVFDFATRQSRVCATPLPLALAFGCALLCPSWAHACPTLLQVFTAASAPEDTELQGHNGADYFLMESFVNVRAQCCLARQPFGHIFLYQAVRYDNPAFVLSGPHDTLESHLIVFAAELSKREDRCSPLCSSPTSWCDTAPRALTARRVVHMAEFCKAVAESCPAGPDTSFGSELSEGDTNTDTGQRESVITAAAAADMPLEEL